MENTKQKTAVETLLYELEHSITSLKRTKADLLHLMWSMDEAFANEKNQIVEAMMHCGFTKEEAENYYHEKFVK